MKPEPYDSDQTPLVHRLLTSLVRGVCRFPRLVLLGSLLLAGLSFYGFNTCLEYHTRRSDLISPNKDYQQRWRQYIAEFGEDEDIVVVVQGADRQRMRQALEALAAEVQRQPRLFDRLFYKVDLQQLRDRALLYLPTEQIQQIHHNIQSMSLLLDLGPISWQSLTLYSLLHEARDRASKLNPATPLRPIDEQFLTQLLAVSRSAAATLADPPAYHNPWHSLLPQAPGQQDLMSEPQFFFSGDGSLAFLLTRPTREESSFTGSKPSVDAMRAIVAGVRPVFPELHFGLTGLPVLESDEMSAAQHDTRLASWLAVAGVTLLFFLVYRGIWYPLLTVATLLVGTAWAMGWLTADRRPSQHPVGDVCGHADRHGRLRRALGDALRAGAAGRGRRSHRPVAHDDARRHRQSDGGHDARVGILRGHVGRLPGRRRARLDCRLRRTPLRPGLLHRVAGAADGL